MLHHRATAAKNQVSESDWHLLGLGSDEDCFKKFASSTGQIRIENVSRRHSGTFLCRGIMTGNVGSHDARFRLKVSEIVPARVDLFRTNLLDERLIFRPGDNLTLRCPAIGSPKPETDWFKDGQKIDLVSQVLPLA